MFNQRQGKGQPAPPPVGPAPASQEAPPAPAPAAEQQTAAAPPPSAAPQQGQRYPCKGCGADMVWDPKVSMLQCPYCGYQEMVEGSGAQVEERSFDAFLEAGAGRMAKMTPQALEVTCSGCGSIVNFEPPDVAGECPFCGAKIVAQPHAADPLVAPEGVLPFKIPQKDATEAIRKWLGTRWFAPNALKRQAQQGAINGVYLPFWTYDADTRSRYSGQRGEYYYVTENYTTTENGKTVQRSRQVRKTRWYSASGHVSRAFDDVLVAGTRSLPRNRLDSLEPWDLPEIKTYEPSFLSGFKAQRYQVDLKEGFTLARGVMAQVIEGDVRRDIGGDEQRIHNVSTDYADVTFKHLLLPIWISAYQYGGKTFQTMVNARTGEVQGDRPYSIWKIAFLVLVILIVLGIIAALNQGGGSGSSVGQAPPRVAAAALTPVPSPNNGRGVPATVSVVGPREGAPEGQSTSWSTLPSPSFRGRGPGGGSRQAAVGSAPGTPLPLLGEGTGVRAANSRVWNHSTAGISPSRRPSRSRASYGRASRPRTASTRTASGASRA